MPVRVIVADDQELVRAGVVMILSAAADIQVVGEAGTGSEAIALAHELSPDVVVMDVRMPDMDGVAATRALTADRSGEAADHPVRVLVLTTFADDAALYGSLRAGAHGFLLKHAAPSDLATAIRRLAGGDAWIDPTIAHRVIDTVLRSPVRPPQTSELEVLLTPREREVMGLMALGMSNGELAERLVLSEATVKTHVARVIMKTGSRDRAQAVALAYQSGMVRVPN